MAAIQGGLGLWLGGAVWVDALAYAGGAFFLRRFESRLAAALLVFFALVASGVTVANRLGMQLAGGNNIFLALLALGAAGKAMEATWKLHGALAAEGAVRAAERIQVSVLRRLVVIFGYVAGLTIVAVLLSTMLVSEACMTADLCSRSDDIILGVALLGWLAGLIATAIFGWRGFLLGARARTPSAGRQIP